MEYLLKVKNLTVSFEEAVVQNVSFAVRPGEIAGIVGESGSGKSMSVLSLIGLLPEDAICTMDEFQFEGENKKMMPGKDIAMIFQEPMTSLNPVMCIGKQIEEMLIVHLTMKKSRRRQQVLEMLERVGLPGTMEFYKKYPHELSGGMRQRVMIAMAMICHPKILIADEPTTALDHEVQDQIIKLIQDLSSDFGTAVLFISHDINLVHEFCHYVYVMNDGRIVEKGTVEEVFHHPKEDYTKKLLDALPSKEKKEKDQITQQTVLKVEDLHAGYGEEEILRGISFELKEGEVLGIKGPSGCGKTTMSQCILGLMTGKSGRIERFHNKIGMVFQDPYSSLNPSKTVGWLLEEPLRIQGGLTREERKRRVEDMLGEIGLKKKYLKRKIKKMSGGQRQRVAIGVSLITHPKVVILDEPVSALDVTVQDMICKLLIQCKDDFKLSYIFISHDKDVMEMMCSRILEMKEGTLTHDY